MDDKSLIMELEKWMKIHDKTYDDVAKTLGFSRSTIFNWKKGKEISARGRSAIKVYIADTHTTNKTMCCPISCCPAQNPTDRLLQFVLEEWGNLSATAKGEIVAVVERDKKDRNDAGNYTQKQA